MYSDPTDERCCHAHSVTPRCPSCCQVLLLAGPILTHCLCREDLHLAKTHCSFVRYLSPTQNGKKNGIILRFLVSCLLSNPVKNTILCFSVRHPRNGWEKETGGESVVREGRGSVVDTFTPC